MTESGIVNEIGQQLRDINEREDLPRVNMATYEAARAQRRVRKRRVRYITPPVVFYITLAVVLPSMALAYLEGARFAWLLAVSAVVSLISLIVGERGKLARTTRESDPPLGRIHFNTFESGIIFVFLLLCGFWYVYIVL